MFSFRGMQCPLYVFKAYMANLLSAPFSYISMNQWDQLANLVYSD